ncbi:DUF192 domain-containing protein [Sulfitobacter albidus]|uniref:DUF192 domain-containing protein n=1 Tax=Sulfitobacter albidus TaxID=2829501 RepID=A0A975JG39_9RHOB|nr:DUF192 domain-containing protein [Sulfitobacter albidus]QUJ77828.1 DUF192 domain-containing protein [Sulfitobacter albidus]
MGNGHITTRRGALALGLAALLAAPVAAQRVPIPCAPERVTIRGDFGAAVFTVDVVADPASRAQGLMHVEQMSLSRGMLFIYERPERLSFWMRNTLIPLDMLFLDSDGVIRHIHENAIPLDETPISGGPDPLLGVLEINGGLAARLGISVGDRLEHGAFGPARDTWECTPA